MVALILIVAFENLAVTTVMPLITDIFDGAHLYALAFGGPLAISVIGMVVAGNWADRTGPVPPLLASVALFVLGLIVAGAANSMETLVVGRLLHGLGGGGINVALYVMVARAFPSSLHPSIFAGFAAAWVLPSVIGPFLGGLVAEYFGWRWVFFGVVFLCAPSLVAMRPSLRQLREKVMPNPVPWSLKRLLIASVVCIGVIVMDLTAASGSVIGWATAGVSAVVTMIALLQLLPSGTGALRVGLPSVIAMRGVLSGGFIAAEVYLPYLLTDVYHVSPSLTGASLTVGGLTWAAASQLHARLSRRFSGRRFLITGSTLLVIATTLVFITTWLDSGPLLIVLCWAIAGAGMGLSYPRLGTMTLALSTPHNSGFNSAALSISDSIGAALALTVAGAGFVTLGGPANINGFLAAFGLAILLAATAILAGWRACEVAEPSPIP